MQRNFNENASGSTNQIELATATVRRFLIPLPPSFEQRKIVRRVDDLVAVVDRLRETAKRCDGQAARLLASLENSYLD